MRREVIAPGVLSWLLESAVSSRGSVVIPEGEDKMNAEQKRLAHHMLKSLEAPYKRLTNWELEFVESVSEQFLDRGTLSDKQMEVLERIYAEKTA